MSEPHKLTKYSHGGGCGCKIAPSVLEKILHGGDPWPSAPNTLLVGAEKRDDAAVLDLGDGRAILSTTDFFMPIVDDAYDFGRIAAANALSDIYAMGGKPLLAVAILGWPVNTVPVELAARVLSGARAVCSQAGIPLAGGHSIDNPEPLFGLAVTGEVKIENIKKNNAPSAEGCLLFLTKPLGIGLITTAQKRSLVQPADFEAALEAMLTLNTLGTTLGELPYVAALTDVTGFGLLGHLGEMVDGSETVSAELFWERIPLLPNLPYYVEKDTVSRGVHRNWASYGEGIVGVDSEYKKAVLCDPQTSGGLLAAVQPDKLADFVAILQKNGVPWTEPIGRLTPKELGRRIVVHSE